MPILSRLALCAALPLLASTEWRPQGATRVEVEAKGHVQAAPQPRLPWEAAAESDELCAQLRRVLMLRGCRSGLPVHLLQQPSEHSHASATGRWPLRNCRLPKPAKPPPLFQPRGEDQKACATVVLAATATGVEHVWRSLPPGGLVVVPLLSNSTDVQPDQLVWQSLYQLNSHMFYSEFHDLKAPELGLRDLQFATFFRGYGVLQKADWEHDGTSARGRFHSLATSLKSDKIASERSYQLLYHRTLDRAGRDQKGGIAVEVGTGCTMKNGLGESSKLWPRFFKHLRVHLMRGESDRHCVAHWMDNIHSNGVAMVHIGQASSIGKANPVQTIKMHAGISGPAGLQVVVDNDEAGNAETEAAFRGLFPKLAPGGLYFLEDIMHATWGDYNNMPLMSKYSHTASTPLALSAAMATAAAGLQDEDVKLSEEDANEALEDLRGEENPRGLWPASTRLASALLQHARAYLSGTATSRSWSNEVIDHKARVWIEDLMLSHGRMVDFVECSPGVCAIQRNREPTK